jgi:hypothetical protein
MAHSTTLSRERYLTFPDMFSKIWAQAQNRAFFTQIRIQGAVHSHGVYLVSRKAFHAR